MTGFGFAEFQNEIVHVVVDMKSYNNRYLDLQVNLPPLLGPLEPRVREQLSATVARGRVEVFVKVDFFEEQLDVRVDHQAARTYARALDELIKSTGLDDKVRLSHLMRIEGVLKLHKRRDLDRTWLWLKPQVELAAAELDKTRLKEGRIIGQDIGSHLALVEGCVAEIEQCKGDLKANITNGLRERFYELLGDDLDENRIFSETALLLMKFDISEELTRMKSQLDDFREILEIAGRGVGKKLDFICQELGREINTVSSKSVQLKINTTVVDIKDSLEKIREQLRNVE